MRFVSGCFVVVLALAAWARDARADTVPDVVGLPEAQALELIQTLGFRGVASPANGSGAGLVVSQEPGGLAERPAGTEVKIQVTGAPGPSVGPGPAQPPPSVPRPTVHRPSGATPVAPPDGPPAGDPTGQPDGGGWPMGEPPGAETTPGTTTAEAAPNRQGPEIPNAIQMTQPQAETALARWRVQVESTLAREDLVGKVVNQIPYPGEQLAPGEMVTIVVGIAELPSLDHYVVPMVEGGTRERAQEELSRIGFKASFHSLPSTPDKRGIVISQNPLPGSIAPRGSAVTVRLGTGSTSPTGPRPIPAAPFGGVPDSGSPPPVLPPPTFPSEGPPGGPPVPPSVPPPTVTGPTPPPSVPPSGPGASPPGAPRPAVLLGTPSPIAPAEGSTFPRNFGATFQWSVVQGAQRYEWEIQEERAGQWRSAGSQILRETRYRPARMERGRFRWRVRALSDPSKGEWSPFYRLYMY